MSCTSTFTIPNPIKTRHAKAWVKIPCKYEEKSDEIIYMCLNAGAVCICRQKVWEWTMQWEKNIFTDCHVDRCSITLSSCEKTNLKMFGFISKAVYLSTFQIHVYIAYLFKNLISKKEVIFHKIWHVHFSLLYEFVFTNL